MPHDGQVEGGVPADGGVVGNVDLGPGVEEVPDAVEVTPGGDFIQLFFLRQ